MKILLSILIIAGLYLAVAPWQQLQANAPGITKLEKKQSIAGLDEKPINIFEVSQPAVCAGNNCRQQNPDISIDSRPVIEISSYRLVCPGCENAHGLSIKNYLWHNYPSHNFW